MSIAGEMAGVERARARVRELTPLLFNFDLPIVPSFQVQNIVHVGGYGAELHALRLRLIQTVHT